MNAVETHKIVLDLKESLGAIRTRVESLDAAIDRLDRRLETLEGKLTAHGERLAVIDRDRTIRDASDNSWRALKPGLIVAVVTIVLGAAVAYIVAKKS